MTDVVPPLSTVEYRLGNPVDLFRLKHNVQRNYARHVEFWGGKAKQFYADSRPVRECILCGSAEYDVVGQIYGWPWHQCRACTHAYNGRRLPPEKYLDFYRVTDEAINYSDTYTDGAVQEYRTRSVATPKVDYIAGHCRTPRGAWLDVATGNGNLLAIARAHGFETMGIEINAAAVEYGKRTFGVDIFHGTIEQFERTNQRSWDVMSFLGISDIIVNPVEYIRIAFRLLAESGIMAMSFPNFNSLSRTVQLTYPDQLVCRFMYPSVISVYTEESATRALAREGFAVEAIWYYGMDIYELISNLSVSDARFRGSQTDVLLRALSLPLQQAVDDERYSDEFLVIARKPAAARA